MWYNPTFKEHVIATLKVLVIIAIGFILMLTFGCKGMDKYSPDVNAFTMTNKYKVGDVVYLKPDSTKALIVKINLSSYSLHKVEKEDFITRTLCGEEAIYGKEE